MKDGKPERSSLEDIEDAERFAKRLEADFCREEGFYQIVKSMENKIKLHEWHAEIDAEEAEHCEGAELGATEDDMLPPKMRRKIQRVIAARKEAVKAKEKEEEKAESKMKRWSNMQVFLKKGQDQIKKMLKTMTRGEQCRALYQRHGRARRRRRV